MRILANIIAAMHAIIVLIIFYELAEGIVCKLYKKIFKKDLKKKKPSALDEYDFELEELDDLSTPSETDISKDTIREITDYDDIHAIVREKIFSHSFRGFDSVSDEDKLAVEYLLSALIDFLRIEALEEEKSFPTLRYFIDCIVLDENIYDDEDYKFSCPVENVLTEKLIKGERWPRYYADYLKAKELAPDFGRVVKIAYNLVTEIVKNLYSDFFEVAREFDCAASVESLKWAELRNISSSYRKVR